MKREPKIIIKSTNVNVLSTNVINVLSTNVINVLSISVMCRLHFMLFFANHE